MKSTRTLLLGIVATVLLGGANVSLTAQDPDCSKWCGCSSTFSFGTRDGCGSSSGCAWVMCTHSRSGCGDTYNDICGTPDWCENSSC